MHLTYEAWADGGNELCAKGKSTMRQVGLVEPISTQRDK